MWTIGCRDRLQHLRSFSCGVLESATPFPGWMGAADSHCLVVNGVPKSGTYLLRQVALSLTGWPAAPVHVNASNWAGAGGDTHLSRAGWSLRRARFGMVLASHLPHTWWTAATLHAHGKAFIHWMIYRDPRDALVSWGRFHPSVSSLPDGERVHRAVHARVGFPAYRWAPWRQDQRCTSVRFRDLYLDLLNEVERSETIERLVDSLPMPPALTTVKDLAREVLWSGPTATDMKQKVGQWRRDISPSDTLYLQRHPVFTRTMNQLGFSW